MKMDIRDIIRQSIQVKRALLDDAGLVGRIGEAARMMAGCLRAGGKVHFAGNGGSAADAQHLAAELSGRFCFDRPPLNAEALHVNTSYLTAVGNDYGYEFVFSRLLAGAGKKGDVLVGISTSGSSGNVVRAFETARGKGIMTVAMTGMSGGRLKPLSDILLDVPSSCTPRIQECHILIGHILCEIIEDDMFGNLKPSPQIR